MAMRSVTAPSIVTSESSSLPLALSGTAAPVVASTIHCTRNFASNNHVPAGVSSVMSGRKGPEHPGRTALYMMFAPPGNCTRMPPGRMCSARVRETWSVVASFSRRLRGSWASVEFAGSNESAVVGCRPFSTSRHIVTNTQYSYNSAARLGIGHLARVGD